MLRRSVIALCILAAPASAGSPPAQKPPELTTFHANPAFNRGGLVAKKAVPSTSARGATTAATARVGKPPELSTITAPDSRGLSEAQARLSAKRAALSRPPAVRSALAPRVWSPASGVKPAHVTTTGPASTSPAQRAKLDAARAASSHTQP
jgi:hypothetical protein